MDTSKFDNFMNDVIVHKNTARKYAPSGYDLELGDKKEEIIALNTEQNISRRAIHDSLIKADIISEDRSFKSFSVWMTKSIKKNRESNAEKDKRAHPVVDNED